MQNETLPTIKSVATTVIPFFARYLERVCSIRTAATGSDAEVTPDVVRSIRGRGGRATQRGEDAAGASPARAEPGGTTAAPTGAWPRPKIPPYM
jgi:hypothetical protein